MTECENKCMKKEDLLEYEKEALKEQSKLKDMLLKEIWDDRHACKWKHQDRILEIWDNKEWIALLNQSNNTMADNFKEIKKEFKESFHNMEDKFEKWFNKVENQIQAFIKAVEKWYVTKTEHDLVISELSTYRRIFWFIWLSLLWVICTALWKLILK